MVWGQELKGAEELRLEVENYHGDIRDVLLAIAELLEPDYIVGWAISKNRKSAAVLIDYNRENEVKDT